METHDIHGIKVDFHSGTEDVMKMLKGMDKDAARKFLEKAKSPDKSYIMNSKVLHKEEDGKDHFAVRLHSR